MHTHTSKEQAAAVRHLSHLNFLFTGWGSHVYERIMVPLTRGLYRRVIEDMTALHLSEGQVLDAGTGPGVLAREIARTFPQLQVYGIDLSEEMIRLARQHTKQEQLEKRIHFDCGNVAHLPYPDHAFDLVVSTISMHHWSELEQPFREFARVLRPGGRLWIYDGRLLNTQTVEQALASTSFGATRLEDTLVRTGHWPFALYKRFALKVSSV